MPGLIAAGGALVQEEHGIVIGYAILDLETGEVDAVFVDPHGRDAAPVYERMQALGANSRRRMM